MSNIWHIQFADKWVSKSVELKLQDQYINSYVCQISVYPQRGYVIEFLKQKLSLKTILIFYPFNHLYTLCKFRCGSHRLPIETGRWQGITRDNRVCHLIDSNDIGNEYHYVMICHSMKADRKKILSEYFWKYPNTCKFNLLFKCYTTRKAVQIY